MSVRMEIDGTVLRVTLSRPEALNALGPTELDGLAAAVVRAEFDDVHAVVLTGDGRAFCAGVDLLASEDPAFFAEVLRRRFNPVVLGLLGLGKPIVTAVNGVAAGAGVSLAMIGDVRLGSQEAAFVAAFAGLGISPDAGFTAHAVRLMGLASAVEFALGGERWPANRAEAAGILTSIVPAADLASTAAETAARLSRAPLATTAATLALLRQSGSHSIAAQLEAEARAQQALLANPLIRDHMERRRRSIVDKSRPSGPATGSSTAV